MKYIPILFSTPMVQAILEGRKSMTRRAVKDPHVLSCLSEGTLPSYFNSYDHVFCKYGKPGDILWVREKWRKNDTPTGYPYHFYTDDDYTNKDNEKWRPSIFMPKDACRIFLQVTDVRVERLQDINTEDAVKEGIACVSKDGGRNYKFGIPDADGYPGSGEVGWKWQDWQATPTQAFEHLWKKINGDESWSNNPWVWCITFKKVDRPSNFLNN